MLPNPQKTGDLITFTEEILNAKLHFLCRKSDLHDTLALLSTKLLFSPLTLSSVVIHIIFGPYPRKMM